MTSSESSLEGKLFVEFVALIYLSYIQKKMEEKGLFAAYTLHELLDELDVIECFMDHTAVGSVLVSIRLFRLSVKPHPPSKKNW